MDFYNNDGDKIEYSNIAVDGQAVDNETVQPAFPPNGWWAVCGLYHSVLFDFHEVTHVKEVKFWCANSASTPKYMRFTDAKERAEEVEEGQGFRTDLCLQLAGKFVGKDPSELQFLSGKGDSKELSCQEVVDMLNETPPQNGFQDFISVCKEYNFVFFKEGLKTRVCNYFFGTDPTDAVQLANSLISDSHASPVIDDVAKRAMTLEELRAVRAMIVSACIKNKWKSSLDGKRLRPSDVNLYDLNSILIKPMTKKRNCSFKELFPSGESTPTYYVSHWWGEKVLDFINCCEYHAMAHNLSPSKARYWVCAYANRQHDLGTDLGTDPSKSSFNRAMQMAEGVLLVIDPQVVVTSRIWVDYELFRTITTKNMIDIAVYHKGDVHLIADKSLPNETPYQKNRREMKFPFAEVCEKFLALVLSDGDASEEIDKVRILNTMRKKPDDLDDTSVLKRIKTKDSSSLQFQQDMREFSKSDGSLRAEMASKALSVALGSGQSLESFHGYDLLDIIMKDTLRTELIFDDLVSLDEMTDYAFDKIITLIGPKIEKFVLNVCGCRNLTEAIIQNLELPSTLKDLDLNIGYAPNIENEALLHLATVIPQDLEKLSIDVTGFKTPSGSYEPFRHHDHLKQFAVHMPPNLVTYELVTTLDKEQKDEGLLDLAKSLPRDLKEFTIVLHSWEGFKGEFLTNMVENLPRSLKSISIKMYGGEYFGDEDYERFSSEIKNFGDLSDFCLHTRDDGRDGFYRVRDCIDLAELPWR